MKRFLIIAIALATAACQKDGVPTYSGDNFVEFPGKIQDTLTMAFYLHSDASIFDFPLTLQLSGQAPGQERAFALAVDTKYSTAVAGTHFEMPATTTFAAGAFETHPAIRFLRTESMKSEKFLLVLTVADTEWFKAGQWERRRVAIWVHDQLVKPNWWTLYVQANYLGVYSPERYRHFLLATGYPDLGNTTVENNLMRYYALIFKRYLEDKAKAGEPVYEADNSTLITVPVIN